MILSQFKVKMVSKAVESAQKRVEGNNFDARKRLLQYDDVLRQQREIIYKQRNEVLESENMREIVEKMIQAIIDKQLLLIHQGEEESSGIYKELKIMFNANLLLKGILLTAKILKAKHLKK